MRRRDFFKLAIGATVAAVVLPELVAKKTGINGLAYHIENPRPMYQDIFLTAGDTACPRTGGGLDIYTAGGVYKGIYRL